MSDKKGSKAALQDQAAKSPEAAAVSNPPTPSAASEEPAANKKSSDPPAPPEEKPSAKAKQVRVISEGTLGPKLLEKGTVTSDPQYVALLKTKSGRRKVEEVK